MKQSEEADPLLESLFLAWDEKYEEYDANLTVHEVDCTIGSLITIYVQTFEANNIHGLLFPSISRKQFLRMKSFECTVF